MSDSKSVLKNRLQYQFKDPALLDLALTHRSAESSNNERLEYLGDAILGFVIAEILFNQHPELAEGLLTRQRAKLVKKDTLAKLARKLELGDAIKLGTGERKSGGWRRDSILANTLEAVIGAVYLDSDFETCRGFVVDLYSELIETLDPEDTGKDSKTELQELLQSRKQPLPDYRIVAEEGDAHAKTFTVECQVASLELAVSGRGKSRRAAEQSAAQKTLNLIQSDN